MKTLLLIYLIACSLKLLAQNPLAGDCELAFQTENFDNSDINTIIIEPVDGYVQYNRTTNVNHPYWYLVNNAEIKSVEIQGEYIGYKKSLDVIYSDDGTQGNTFWVTKNKITIRNGSAPYEEKFYFYINYLNSDLASSAQIDLTISFNSNNQAYYYPGLWMNTIGSMTEIIEGSTLNIWDVHGNIRSTDGFELYLTLSNQENHPKLTWNSYHEPSELVSYKIFKKKNYGSYSLLTTTETNTLEYIDNLEMLYSGSGKSINVYYYVVAELYNNQTSLPSNTVSTKVNMQLDKESTPPPQHSIIEFKLNQNYPNLRLRLC